MFFFSRGEYLIFMSPPCRAWQGFEQGRSGVCFFKILLVFRERGREGEREGEKHQCVVASHTPPTGDLAHNPGMCPDWESNQQAFGFQAGTQSTEPHQPGREGWFWRSLQSLHALSPLDPFSSFRRQTPWDCHPHFTEEKAEAWTQ